MHKMIMSFVVLVLSVAGIVMLSSCGDLDKSAPSSPTSTSLTGNDPGSSEQLEYPASEWNEFVTHADGDSIPADAMRKFAGPRAVSEPVGAYNSFPWGWHLPFKGCWYMTCGYGCGYHNGADLYATDWANGTCDSDVLAPGAGWVLWAGWKSGYGYTVLIESGPTGLANGYRYIYRVAHLSRIDVVPGWWLPQGYRIGKVGNTGTTQGATGCHIHWVVYRGNYIGYGNIDGSSFPTSFSTGVDGYNGDKLSKRWCSLM